MQGAQQWNAEKQAKMAEQRCEAMMENMMAGLVGGPFQGGGMQQQRRAPEERVCFHCGEKGHMKWACPKLKAQEKEQWLAEARASGLVKQEPMPPQPLMPATQPAPHSVMGAPHSVGVAHSAAQPLAMVPYQVPPPQQQPVQALPQPTPMPGVVTKSELASFKDEVSQAVCDMVRHKVMQPMQDQQASIAETLSETTEAVSGMRTKMGEMGSRLEVLVTEKGTLKGKLTALTAKIAELEQGIATHGNCLGLQNDRLAKIEKDAVRNNAAAPPKRRRTAGGGVVIEAAEAEEEEEAAVEEVEPAEAEAAGVGATPATASRATPPRKAKAKKKAEADSDAPASKKSSGKKKAKA